MHIALKDRPNNGEISVVGKVADKDFSLMSSILPWQNFILKFDMEQS